MSKRYDGRYPPATFFATRVPMVATANSRRIYDALFITQQKQPVV